MVLVPPSTQLLSNNIEQAIVYLKIKNKNTHRDKICHPHHHPLFHHHCLLQLPSIFYSKFILFCYFKDPISLHTLSIAWVIGILMLFIIRFETGDAAAIISRLYSVNARLKLKTNLNTNGKSVNFKLLSFSEKCSRNIHSTSPVSSKCMNILLGDW